MKSYQVFYIIKEGGKEELNHIYVFADNQKQAIENCKIAVKETKGEHAFRATTKIPHYVEAITGKKVLTI